MKYKINKDYFDSNPAETVNFSRFEKVGGNYTIGKETFKQVSKNQDLLEQLYRAGKPYVCLVDNKKCTKKKKANDYKETKSKQKEEQVSPEASEE
tara:strand:+ start:2345 stop:2629 length:285 start_codon:yes stop_codon:yes gene_type:complete